MGKPISKEMILSGRKFSIRELEEIQETVSIFRNLSRKELAITICEHFSWYQLNGKYKVNSSLKGLERLERLGYIRLPDVRKCRRNKTGEIVFTIRGKEREDIKGSVEDWEPIIIEAIKDKEEALLWNEYVERYHYLGYKQPFGAYRKYFIISRHGKDLGCLLYAASSWSVACRDEWIGWSQLDRSERLHLVVNNSRFLIFPWVHIKNLASKALSIAARYVPEDWQRLYSYRPVLFETYVDKARFKGTCYRAANWKHVGTTKGYGRMSRHKEKVLPIKDVYLYPLCRNFRQYLLGKVSPALRQEGVSQ